MKRLIILTTLLVTFFGWNISAQRVFTIEEQDCIAHDLIQLKALRIDSATKAEKLLVCDSVKTALNIKYNTANYQYHTADSTGKACDKANTALTNKYNKLVNKIKVFKNGLLITIPITIAEAFALWYVVRNKK